MIMSVVMDPEVSRWKGRRRGSTIRPCREIPLVHKGELDEPDRSEKSNVQTRCRKGKIGMKESGGKMGERSRRRKRVATNIGAGHDSNASVCSCLHAKTPSFSLAQPCRALPRVSASSSSLIIGGWLHQDACLIQLTTPYLTGVTRSHYVIIQPRSLAARSPKPET